MIFKWYFIANMESFPVDMVELERYVLKDLIADKTLWVQLKAGCLIQVGLGSTSPSNNNNNNLYLYSALIQFVSKALYNEIHNMHRKHKNNKKTLLPISKLLISGVIYHGKLG